MPCVPPAYVTGKEEESRTEGLTYCQWGLLLLTSVEQQARRKTAAGLSLNLDLETPLPSLTVNGQEALPSTLYFSTTQ